MAAATQLSSHDSTTLSLLFDPESSPSSNTAPISAELPQDPFYTAETLALLQGTERRAISLAETSPAEALRLFDELLVSHQQYASGYNNRAQLRRILSHPSAEVKADLDKAISLARPRTKLEPVSMLQAKVLSNAYTQLGAVLLREGKEEEAGAVFREGARYGGDVARSMAVKLNPVARLCGAIVKEAMRKEMTIGR
jgi:tetratricopeptide (TPR) repeat protein